MLKSKWTLAEGLTTAREIQNITEAYGWHVGIAGGVMKRGESDKDLDLVFFPHSSKQNITKTWHQVQVSLETLGYTQYRTVKEMHGFWRKAGGKDRKHVEVWQCPQGRRIDFIRWSA